ncbi:unnamed protein product [Pedinophyceae sp. YPF-701]|nr:unnamed protein product [Pedinophyceae sp. YPF-701]
MSCACVAHRPPPSQQAARTRDLRRRPSGAVLRHPPAPHAAQRTSPARGAPARAQAPGAGGAAREVVYLRNFLPRQEFEAVCAEVASLAARSLKPERNSIAEGRRGCYLPPDSPAVRALLSPDAIARIARKLGVPRGVRLRPSAFPAEVRRYPVGAQMQWHVDELMYEEPQVELVLTVANSSDSLTEWREPDGAVESHRTEPNSVLALVAGGASHRVTPVRRGDRTIIKTVLTSTDRTLPAFEQNLGRANY